MTSRCKRGEEGDPERTKAEAEPEGSLTMFPCEETCSIHRSSKNTSESTFELHTLRGDEDDVH
jgi:hypothetical protein